MFGVAGTANCQVPDAELGNAAVAPEISYRRIFVPAGDIEIWPVEDEKFLPVESGEFQKLISAANGADKSARPRATIIEAIYNGRMLDNKRVVGRGSWRVELHGKSPVFMPLGKISPAIREPHWRDDSSDTVRWGFWGHRERNADLFGVEVTRSGVLDFGWQLGVDAQPNAAMNDWRLPTAATTRLTLDLPATHRPLVEGGIILASNSLSESIATSDALRRWEIALGGSPHSALRIIQTDNALEKPTPGVPLWDEVAYRLDERGAEIVAALHFEQHPPTLRELVVPLPDRVQFLSATSAGKELAWRIATRQPRATGELIVTLPDSTPYAPLTVTLRSWQPLQASQEWQMPLMRPMGTFWTAGTMELSVGPTLELQRLEVVDCLQTGVVQSAQGGTGAEAYWFTAYSPNACLNLAVNHQQPDVAVHLGSSLAISESGISGRLTTQLDVASGNVHHLLGHLAPGWVVEAVDAIPEDAIGEWSVNRQNGAAEIVIQFAKPPNPSRNVTVVVDGRFAPATLVEPISAESLRMVKWNGPRVEEHLLAVQTVEPYAVEPNGALPVAGPPHLTSAIGTLIKTNTAEGEVFDLTRAHKSSGLRVAVEREEFEASITLDAVVADGKAGLNYKLDAKPMQSRVERLLIFATAPLGDGVRWTDRESGVTLQAERLPATDPRHAGFAKGGELWSVRLSQPAVGPFGVVAAQTLAISRRQQLPLLSLPRAVQQHGRIHVAADVGHLPVVVQAKLQPVPLPLEVNDLSRAGASSPVVGAYLYNPFDCLEATRSPRLWLSQRASDPNRQLIARHAEIESFFSADGRVVHQTVYQLDAAEPVELQLPAGTENAFAWIDGRPLRLMQSSPREFSFRVPKHDRSATLQIHFQTRRDALTVGAELWPPLLENARMLSGEWNVWLPAELEASNTIDWQIKDLLNWRRRLFGPLGRPSESEPFNPFQAASWGVIGSGLPAADGARQEEEFPTDTEIVAETQINRVTASTGDHSRLDGWRKYQVQFVANAPAPLVISKSPAAAAWAVTLFLFCTVIGRRIARWHSRIFVALVAGAAGLALVLPATVAPLATGVLLGLLMSVVVVRPRWPANHDSPTKTWNRRATIGATAIVLMGICTRNSLAQLRQYESPRNSSKIPEILEPSGGAQAGAAAAPAVIHRVLIPVDAERQPVGDKYYVDESFLRRLLELAGDDSAEHNWLVVDAACHAELVDRSNPRDLTAGRWNLVLDIEVLTRDTTIVLPLVRNQATWQDVATLDGLPAPLQWRPDGRSCMLEIVEPGRYTLEVSLVPRIQLAGDHNQIDLGIPAFPGGQFRLRFPAGTSDIALTGVDVTSQSDASPNSLAGELDDSGQISVRWPRKLTLPDEDTGLRVTELQWLHVTPNDVVLDCKFVVEGAGRRPESLAVTYDSPWSLIDASDVISTDPSDAGRRTVQIALPPDDIDRQEVHLRWQLDDTGTLGHLLLPRIELVSLPVTQTWFAVSSEPALNCEFIGVDDAMRGTPAEFQARWGDALDANNLGVVLANDRGDHALAVSVRPRATSPTFNESLHITADADGLRVQYEAEVNSGATQQFQTTLFVSDDVQIDEVTLVQEGQSVPIRWCRASKNSLTIFFSEGVADSYRLNVVGHVPSNDEETYLIPRVAINSAAADQRVRFYRRDDVLLAMQGFDDSERSQAGAAESTPPLAGRFEGEYQLGPTGFEAGQLVVTPNRIRATGQTTTIIERDSDAWWATFVCRLTVEQGELGTLSLRAPAMWADVIQLLSNKSATHEVVERNNQQSEVVVRFSDAAVPGATIEFRLRGRLNTQASAQIAAPDIRLDMDFRGPHYVLVPLIVDSQAIAWTEGGVRPVEPPAELLELAPKSTPPSAFQITARPIRVVLRPTPAAPDSATVRLADTLVASGPYGGQLSVTRMVVVSQGLAECVLELPPQQQLVSVLSDGRPALTRQLGERRWSLPMGAAKLPQFVEVVSHSSERSLPANGRFNFARPVLLHDGKPLSVEVSLWTIGFPSSPTRLAVEGAAVVPAIEQAALRLDRLVGIVESATAGAIDYPLPDGQSWYAAWASRLTALRQQLFAANPAVRGDRSALQVDLTAEQQLADASKRLDVWFDQGAQVWTFSASAQPPATSSHQGQLLAWDLGMSAASHWTYCVAEGDAAQLAFVVAPSSAAPIRSRAGELLAIFAVAAAAIAFFRSPAGIELMYRWPHGLAFLVGLTYWAILWPSWLGLVIAAGSLWLAVQPGWPGRSVPVETSTVIRTGQLT
jgi:hypothetical protein